MKREAHKKVSHWISRVDFHIEKSSDELHSSESIPLVVESDSENSRCCCLPLTGPDSAWSWVIAFVNFLIVFIGIGLNRMSGIFYVEILSYLKINRMTASTPFSVQAAARNLFGPVAGVLGQKYGLRFVTIGGGVIGCLSAAALYFDMHILTFIIAWGVFFGLSLALTATLNQISIDQHFKRNRATAGGFALSGGSVGGLALPVAVETLLLHYGMPGTFLVLAALLLLVVPAGLMLAEPEWSKRRRASRGPSTDATWYGAIESEQHSLSHDWVTEIKARSPRSPGHRHQGKITKSTNGSGKQQQTFVDFRFLRENGDLVFKFLTMEPRELVSGPSAQREASPKFDKPSLLNEINAIYADVASSTFQTPKPSGLQSEGKGRRFGDSTFLEADEEPIRAHVLNRLRVLGLYRGINLVASFPYWEQSTAWSVLTELRKLHEVLNDQAFAQHTSASQYRSPAPKSSANKHGCRHSPEQSSERSPEDEARSDTLCRQLRTGFALHANPVFLLICLSRAVYNLTFIPALTIIVDFAMDLGLPWSDGKYVVSALSAGDLVGRLCMGWVTDWPCVGLPRFMLLGMVALGACTAALPLVETRAVLFAVLFLIGVLEGSLYVRHPILVTRYLEPHERAVGMGFINLLSGLLLLGVPSFIGYFRDGLGSYNKMFYITGILCAAVGLVWILEPLFISLCSANHNDRRRSAPQTLQSEQ